MRILQVSNLVSHHQLPLARALCQLVGENNFRFCATQAPDAERIRLGWNSDDNDPWILRSAERDEDRIEFELWWDSADIVICGERRFVRMGDRLAKGKLCFYMSERWWKPPFGLVRLLHPSFLSMAMKFRQISKSSEFHYLSIGLNAGKDISLISNLQGRIWRWGYFTDTITSVVERSMTNNRLKILWAGRMLKLKKIDTIIRAVAELAQNQIEFELTFVGDGPERPALEQLASKLLDSRSYVFLNPVSSRHVQEIMCQHNVYILSSSSFEGWGAVINEAMACGCAVVASNAAGAASAMIKDGVNGLLFTPGDWRKLAELLEQLAGSNQLRKNLANAAQRTSKEVWSPQVAAERFYITAKRLLENDALSFYTEGPMSQYKFEK